MKAVDGKCEHCGQGLGRCAMSGCGQRSIPPAARTIDLTDFLREIEVLATDASLGVWDIAAGDVDGTPLVVAVGANTEAPGEVTLVAECADSRDAAHLVTTQPIAMLALCTKVRELQVIIGELARIFLAGVEQADPLAMAPTTRAILERWGKRLEQARSIEVPASLAHPVSVRVV